MISSAQASHRRKAASSGQEDDGYSKIHENSHEMNGTTQYDIQRDEKSTRQTLPVQSFFGVIIHATVCVSWVIYLYLRLQMCLGASRASPSVSWDLWLFLICELILAGPELFQVLEVSFCFTPGRRAGPRPCYRLVGNEAPKVHIFITACGEDVGIIMDTVAGAALQDYPKHCYRVFVLDDSKDVQLKREVDSFNRKECESLGFQPVGYLSRSKEEGVSHYYKAGNLDFGIRISREQYGSSEFIAALDADMIPEYDWLRRTVPHLLYDPGLALVSPPQYSYNVPEGDILAQDANVLQQVLEPVRDLVGCSMCHGSGFIMRREALSSIGGWPQVNVGEDILCSYLLNRAGWQTAFIEDKLQFGIIPDSFHAYVAQRMRWTAGNLLSARKFKFFLPYLNRSKITAVQRFHGWMQAVKTYEWVALIFPLLVLPMFLPLRGSIERDEELPWNKNLVRYMYIIVWTATKIWKRIVFGHVGATNVLNLSHNRYWITPYIVYSYYQSLWVNLEETKFEISGTFISPIDERSEKTRPAIWTRMTNSLVLMHTIYWLIASCSFIYWLLITGRIIALGGQSYAYFHTGATVRLFDIVLATSIPVRYMAFPPSGVDRRGRLGKDHVGANRPIKKTWTKRGDNSLSLKELVEMSIIVMFDWL